MIVFPAFVSGFLLGEKRGESIVCVCPSLSFLPSVLFRALTGTHKPKARLLLLDILPEKVIPEKVSLGLFSVSFLYIFLPTILTQQRD